MSPSIRLRGLVRQVPYAAAAALALFAMVEPCQAQQPFQFPTSVGSAVGFGPVVDVSGNRMLMRRFLAGGAVELGFSDGVGGIVFVPTFNAATSALVNDAKLQRGPNFPATLFYTLPVGATRELRSATVFGGVQSTILTLPAGNWQLAAINSLNTSFFLLDPQTGAIGSVTLGPAPVFTFLATVPGVVQIEVSPDNLSLVLGTSSGPSSPNPILIMSVFGGVATNILPNTNVRSQPHWLNNQFVTCVAVQGATVQVIRVDTLTPGNPVTALTQAPVQVDWSDGFDLSDDRQWMAFVVRQQIGGNTEKVVAAMRVSDGTTADPGGGYIVLGDYRDISQPNPQTLTNWTNLGGVQIRHFPNAVAPTATVHVLHTGRRLFGDPVEFFRTDVRDEIQITPRATPGVTVNVASIAPPFSTFWGVHVSLAREAAPIYIAGVVNPMLINAPASVFSVAAPSNQPVSVPVALPATPTLSGSRLFFQAAWLINQPGQPIHLSQVTELPVF